MFRSKWTIRSILFANKRIEVNYRCIRCLQPAIMHLNVCWIQNLSERILRIWVNSKVSQGRWPVSTNDCAAFKLARGITHFRTLENESEFYRWYSFEINNELGQKFPRKTIEIITSSGQNNSLSNECVYTNLLPRFCRGSRTLGRPLLRLPKAFGPPKSPDIEFSPNPKLLL